MRSRDERPNIRRRVGRPAYSEVLRPFLHRRYEPVINRTFHIDALCAKADLAGVEENGVAHLLDGFLAIAIGKNDGRILTSEFEGNRLHPWRARFHDRGSGT